MALKYRKKWLRFALLPVILLSAYADFTAECQRPCDCRWQSGNKAAICSNSSLKTIPGNLSSDIQILDLSNNHLQQLQKEAFFRAGLSNLKKLFLRDCSIETVHRSAFHSLAIMIEIDLSRNRIQYLHPDTFRAAEKLRLINLNNNLIENLEDGLFRGLKYLQKVEMSNNVIVRIGIKTFSNLPQLKILRLDGNQLSHMKPETLMGLSNLSGLDLHNNPWRCDCNVQTFRNWVISHNLYTPPTACKEPAALRGKLWNELDSSNFACRPTILEPLPDAIVKSYDENVTLTCKVVGNPTPEVAWRFNSRMIEPRAFGEIRYAVGDNTVDLIRWVNLTILNARYSDRGNYTCVAENPGGRDEKTLTLVLSKYNVGTIAGMNVDTFAILVACFTAILIIIGSITAVCYFTSQKNDAKKLIKSDGRCNGEALIEGSVGSELEKGFATEVNPLTKPPRKHEAPPSLTSAATEMSELNRTLLDNDSTLAPSEDNIRHHDIESIPKMSQETLLLDRLAQDHLAYPPDLLTFPLRGAQISPACAISDRHNPSDSPIKSPGYGVTALNPNLYSRFQAPSTSAQGAIPLATKGGYVTLPRKPRMNWLPDNPQVYSTLNGVIPYCDNFGMKLFNHGGNYYSLNKSEIDIANSKIMNTSYHIPHSENVDEIEPAPSPAPGTPHANIPRNSLSSPNIHNQLLALQAMSMNRTKVPVSSEPRPLKVIVTPPETESLLRDTGREYKSNLNGAGTLGRSRNAPKPPLKPRKRSNEMKEPFLLNSGETATQV